MAPDSKQKFKEFRTTSLERWRTVTEQLSLNSPERFPNGYYEVSIHPIGSTPAQSLNELKERLASARSIKLSGWTPFLEMAYEPWRPYPINDHIEAWLGRRIDENTPREPQYSDYWRASQSGQLYTIRGYTEDSLKSLKDIERVEPGTILDITLPVKRTGEIIYFAGRLIAEFKDVQSVLINCRFTGLSGRIITSRDLRHRSVHTHPSCEDKVEKDTQVTPQQLEENVVEITHQLLEPLYEAFNFFKLKRTLVEEELAILRKNKF